MKFLRGILRKGGRDDLTLTEGKRNPDDAAIKQFNEFECTEGQRRTRRDVKGSKQSNRRPEIVEGHHRQSLQGTHVLIRITNRQTHSEKVEHLKAVLLSERLVY